MTRTKFAALSCAAGLLVAGNALLAGAQQSAPPQPPAAENQAESNRTQDRANANQNQPEANQRNQANQAQDAQNRAGQDQPPPAPQDRPQPVQADAPRDANAPPPRPEDRDLGAPPRGPQDQFQQGQFQQDQFQQGQDPRAMRGQADLGVQFDQSQQGLTITNIQQDALLARAGLQQGDVVVAVAGQRVTSPNAFQTMIFQANAPRVPVVVLRNGVEETIWIQTAQFGQPGFGGPVPHGAFYGQQQQFQGQQGYAQPGFVPQHGFADQGFVNQGFAASGCPLQSQGFVDQSFAHTQPMWHQGQMAQSGQWQQGQMWQQGQAWQGQTQQFGAPMHAPNRAALGVTLRTQGQDIIVSSVQPNSPAARLGLQPGDMILGVNGQRVNSGQQLSQIIGGLQPGQEVEIGFVTNGQQQQQTIQLDAWGQTFAAGPQQFNGQIDPQRVMRPEFQGQQDLGPMQPINPRQNQQGDLPPAPPEFEPDSNRGPTGDQASPAPPASPGRSDI